MLRCDDIQQKRQSQRAVAAVVLPDFGRGILETQCRLTGLAEYVAWSHADQAFRIGGFADDRNLGDAFGRDRLEARRRLGFGDGVRHHFGQLLVFCRLTDLNGGGRWGYQSFGKAILEVANCRAADQ